MNKKKDTYDLSAEVAGVSAIVSGLGIAISGKGDKLTEECAVMALFGVANYLERIAKDLEEM